MLIRHSLDFKFSDRVWVLTKCVGVGTNNRNILTSPSIKFSLSRLITTGKGVVLTRYRSCRLWVFLVMPIHWLWSVCKQCVCVCVRAPPPPPLPHGAAILIGCKKSRCFDIKCVRWQDSQVCEMNNLFSFSSGRLSKTSVQCDHYYYNDNYYRYYYCCNYCLFSEQFQRNIF